MHSHDSYVLRYLESGDDDLWEQWMSEQDDLAKSSDALSRIVATKFTDGSISYQQASGLMNIAMPTIGFEVAGKHFWRVYVALENSEVIADSGEAEQKAREAIIEITEKSKA